MFIPQLYDYLLRNLYPDWRSEDALLGEGAGLRPPSQEDGQRPMTMRVPFGVVMLLASQAVFYNVVFGLPEGWLTFNWKGDSVSRGNSTQCECRVN